MGGTAAGGVAAGTGMASGCGRRAGPGAGAGSRLPCAAAPVDVDRGGSFGGFADRALDSRTVRLDRFQLLRAAAGRAYLERRVPETRGDEAAPGNGAGPVRGRSSGSRDCSASDGGGESEARRTEATPDGSRSRG